MATKKSNNFGDTFAVLLGGAGIIAFLALFAYMTGMFDAVKLARDAFSEDDAPAVEPAAPDTPAVQEFEAPEPEVWACSWSPTMNENWHDDVLCTSGSDSIRPILRPNDSYVTQSEMMDAARAYEQELNG